MSSLDAPDWLEPRAYQQDAVNAWVSNQGQGILNMATGTGKTITSLLAATELADHQEGRLVLVVAAPYQHLVDQWVEVLQDFGVTPLRAYQSRTTWTNDVIGRFTEFSSGVREMVAVVTTHATFASDHFQSVLSRVDGSQTLLIADEVHHMGAPHLREHLPDTVRARLGLSATPERWYDEAGTKALTSYFSNGVVFEYKLEEAIANDHLCEYYYVPHIISLTEEEGEDYLALSRAIGKRFASQSGASGDTADADLTADETLKQLLFKRARLIGTAENKLPRVRSLIERSADLYHTLVYCSDGSVGTDEGEGTKRQVRAATQLLGTELGMRVHQFTYEEDQEIRERLLADFESGPLQALVAIRCLDEGVDVPATRTAFILASSSNPRQFVQRRGRILRPHADKDHAVIHDFIVAPPMSVRSAGGHSEFNIERRMIKKELSRVSRFADAAKNHPDADLPRIPTSPHSLSKLKQDFNLLDM
jgi:DNA phosphorothioation system restriction enzyme